MTASLRALTAFIFVTAFSWLTVSSSAPTFWSPISFLVLLPVWLAAPLGRFSLIALAFIPLLCLAWCVPVFKGSKTIPTRSIVLLVLAISLSAMNLYFGIEFGLRWQGHAYVTRVAVISIALWVVLAALAWLAQRQRTQALNTAFHIALFSWLAWYAFPTLGELS